MPMLSREMNSGDDPTKYASLVLFNNLPQHIFYYLEPNNAATRLTDLAIFISKVIKLLM